MRHVLVHDYLGIDLGEVWAVLHREELRRDWELARSGRTPVPIAPLD
jgi:uncharacterized protein with HEPN domain